MFSGSYVIRIVRQKDELHTFKQNVYVMRYAIWYYLYNLKRKKHPWRNATLLKVTLLHGCFSHFLNCTNGTKSRNASHIPKTDLKNDNTGEPLSTLFKLTHLWQMFLFHTP